MRMKLNIKDMERVQATIDIVQSRSHIRNIDAPDVAAAIAYIENKLSNLLPKKDWCGISVRVDKHAQTFPGSYRGIPESTVFTVERFPSGWFITSLLRDHCTNARFRVNGLHKKAEQIARHATNNF